MKILSIMIILIKIIVNNNFIHNKMKKKVIIKQIPI